MMRLQFLRILPPPYLILSPIIVLFICFRALKSRLLASSLSSKTFNSLFVKSFAPPFISIRIVNHFDNLGSGEDGKGEKSTINPHYKT